MDLLQSIPLIGPLLGWVLPFLIVLSIVVAIHELGHLMVGRWCGIKAEVYSIGFGKVIWSRADKHGTVWQIAVLPLGGYVKFLGDMDPASAGQVDDSEIPPEERRHAFHNAALWKRTLTVLAGPVANFILSIVVIAGLALYIGKGSSEPVIGDLGDLTEEQTEFRIGDRVMSIDGEPTETFVDILETLIQARGEPVEVVVERENGQQAFTTRYRTAPRIADISFDGAAIRAGLQPGDLVMDINGRAINSADQLQIMMTELQANEEIEIKIDRQGKLRVFNFVPDVKEREHPVTNEIVPLPTMGVLLDTSSGLSPERVAASPIEALEAGVYRVGYVIERTVSFIYAIFFKGADTSSLSGPIGIAKHSTAAAERGVVDFIHFIAFLSTAIGLFNLFPIPILDGGHLTFYLVEALRGKPTNDAVVRYSMMAGLSLLLMLMVFVTFHNDLGLGEWYASRISQ